MVGLVYAMVFLLNTALNAVGIVLNLTFAADPPEGSSLLGSVGSLGGSDEPGAFILRMTRGSGPSLRTYFTGHWLVNPT
jgi:hypothetical protein